MTYKVAINLFSSLCCHCAVIVLSWSMWCNQAWPQKQRATKDTSLSKSSRKNMWTANFKYCCRKMEMAAKTELDWDGVVFQWEWQSISQVKYRPSLLTVSCRIILCRLSS